jgi:hypothetical protein
MIGWFSGISDIVKCTRDFISIGFHIEHNTMSRQPDFIARLKYRLTEEGGRRTPVKSGYRPQVKFDFVEMQTSGQQIFINKDIVYPGDTVEAEITMVSPHLFARSLYVSKDFEFREGAVVKGIGQILKILNEELRKPKGFYGGMTVNERLYIAGLLDAFNGAVNEKDLRIAVAILEDVDLTMDNIIPILKSSGLETTN